MRICINQATTRAQWNCRASLEGYARHGVKAVSLWRDKVAQLGVPATRRLLHELGLSVVGYNRMGPLLAAPAAERRRLWEEGYRAIDEAAELGAEAVLFFPGGLIPGSKSIRDSLRMTTDAACAMLERARAAGIALALEPLHPMIAAERSLITTMRQANSLCDLLGDGAGIVVDVYHVWWDASLLDEIRHAGERRLLGYHVSDWLVPTQSLVADRGMLGDGLIDLVGITRAMASAGYRGAVEVEIFSERWWREDPNYVVALAVERLSALLARSAHQACS